MRRVFIFLFIATSAILLFPFAAHAQGESVPIYNPAILEKPGPQPDRVNKAPQVAGIAPWGYAVTFVQSIMRKVLDGESFQRVHTIKTVNDTLSGVQAEWSAAQLMPKTLQDNNLKLITYEYHMTANHVQCYYDEDGGERHEPDREIFRPPALGWNKLRGGTKILHSIMSIGELPLPGLDLYTTLPDEKVTPQNGLDCNTEDDGKHVGLYDYGDVEEYYDGTDTNQWTDELFCKDGELAARDACVESNKDKPANEQADCTLVCNGDAHTVYSTRIPAAEEVNVELGKGEQGQKEGFTYAFIPKAINIDFEHGINFQDHTLQFLKFINKDVTTDTSVYYGEYGLKRHMDALNCLNTSMYDPNRPKSCKGPNSAAPTEEETAGGWNCKNVGEQSVPGIIKANGQSYADAVYGSCTNGEENAWEQCNNDVIARAKKACVDPLFALTIWLHETGASNYQCGAQLAGVKPEDIEDFGIHTAAQPHDFSAQLDSFLRQDYSCPHTINDWWSMYWLGNGCFDTVPDGPVNPTTGRTPKQQVEQDVADLQEIYSSLGGGALPAWPKGSCSP